MGVRPSQSKIDTVDQLARANTVKEVRVPLGMTGYLRKFVPRYSALVAPISNLLRDKPFPLKRVRKLKAPRGEEQGRTVGALMLALTSTPFLAMPD